MKTTSRASRSNRSWLPLPALLLGLCPGAGLPGLAAQTTTWQRDFNDDSLTDVSMVEREWTEPVGHGFVHYRGGFLMAGAGGALAALATTNEVVTLEPVPGRVWLSELMLWRILLETGEGWPAFQGPYVGVRFVAADGSHLAWMNFNNLDDFGWQPKPGEPIRVGEKPAAPPPTDQESIRLVVADLDGGGPDVVLRVRWWTNLTSGVTGVSAVVTNRVGFKALVAPGEVDGAPAWFPWLVPEEMLIPARPPPPVSWQGPPAAVVLFQETRDAQGQRLSILGPLARLDAVKIAVRAVGPAAGRKGWVQFNRDFQLVGQDFSGSPGGEPPPQPHESSQGYWDLNGDGWLDFVWVFCADGRYDPLMGRFIGRSWTLLYPLRHSRILSRALPVNAPISLTPTAPDEWQTGGVTLRYEAYIPMTESESSEFPGLVGLRFDGDDGTYLAWLRSGDDEFAFQPQPGVPLPAGVVPRTLAAATIDDELVLSWNRSLSGLVLESAPRLELAAWQPVPLETAGRTAMPLADAARFFRLALPGATTRRARAFPAVPGPVHALAFSGDAQRVVVVDAGGPRLWRIDGTLERESGLLPAEFRMETAAVSAGGGHALCAGGLRAQVGVANAVDEARAFLVRLANMGLETVRCESILNYGCPYPFRGCDVSPDGRQILLTSGGEVVVAEEAGDGLRFVRSLPGSWPVRFSPDGLRAATSYYKAPSGVGLPEGGVQLWNLADGSLVQRFGVASYVGAVAFSADGTRLAIGDGGGGVNVLSLDPGSKEYRWFKAGESAVRCVAFSADGRHVLAADQWSRVARLWRLDTGALLRAFEGHPDAVTALAMSPDNRFVATGTADGLALLWEVSDATGP